jgi:cyclase
LIKEIAEQVGNQSVVVVLDVKKKFFGAKYEIWTHNATKNTGKDPVEFAKLCASYGAGEIIINSIDQDGIMKGYDLHIIDKVRESITLPMTVLGGAGTLDDIGELIMKHGIIGAAAEVYLFSKANISCLINYQTNRERLLMSRDFKVDEKF